MATHYGYADVQWNKNLKAKFSLVRASPPKVAVHPVPLYREQSREMPVNKLGKVICKNSDYVKRKMYIYTDS